MERIRSIKITVEIDTNKQTLKEEFDTLPQAEEYLNTMAEVING